MQHLCLELGTRPAGSWSDPGSGRRFSGSTRVGPGWVGCFRRRFGPVGSNVFLEVFDALQRPWALGRHGVPP